MFRLAADIYIEDEFAFGPGGKARVDDVDEDAKDLEAQRPSRRCVSSASRRPETDNSKIHRGRPESTQSSEPAVPFNASLDAVLYWQGWRLSRSSQASS